jgi:hypothetical protein
MVLYQATKPLLIRTPTVNDVSDKIQRFGLDNLYPQMCDMLLKRSFSLRSVTDRIADFVNGEGFVNEAIGTMIVNTKGIKGQSLNKLLTIVSKPYVNFETVVLHVGYNLNYGISCLTPIPFGYVRFGIKNPSTGTVDFLAYSTNWERDGRKEATDRKITFYDTFNPDPAVVAEQIEKAGGIDNYKGQILYLTPEDGQYPLSTFDSVLDDAQTQIELGTFRVSNIQNSFLSTTAFLYPAGKFNSTQEENDFYDLIGNKIGAANAGTRIGLFDPTGTKSIKDLLMNLTPENLDKLFELTESTAKENIIENYGWPKILQGITTSGLFAKEEIEDAYTYANSITRNRRAQLSEIFSTILQYWGGIEGPINDPCEIIEQRYILNDGQGSTTNVNEVLTNLTGMQNINFARILRKYEQKQYTRQVASQLLKSGFGLSDDEVNSLLDGIDTAIAEDPPKPVEGESAPVPNPKLTQAAFVALAKKHLSL